MTMATDDDMPPSSLLSAYLRASGWSFVSEDDRWANFSLSFGQQKVVLKVPLRHDAIDYERRVRELLANLEKLEQRSIDLVLRDVRAAGSDLVRIRLRGTDKGRISIAHGAVAFEKTRDLLLAAACAALKPRPFYAKSKPKQAIEYLERARFGPTEAGSFIVTVESPVTPDLKNQTKLPGIDDVPFGRQVSLTLARATNAVRSAVDRVSAAGSSAHLLASVNEGVTANLCDALLGLLFATGSQNAIDLNFRWASSRAVPEATPRAVSFDENAATFLDSFSQRLKDQALEKGVVLSGYVEARRSADPNKGGDITLRVVTPSKLHDRMMHIELPSSPYRDATEAHTKRQLFECEGDVFRDVNYQLLNLRGCRIIPSDEH